MELGYGIVGCILFPGYSEENTTMEAADLLCTWVSSGFLPENISISSRMDISGSSCPVKNKDKGFFEEQMDFCLHFAEFITKCVPSVL